MVLYPHQHAGPGGPENKKILFRVHRVCADQEFRNIIVHKAFRLKLFIRIVHSYNFNQNLQICHQVNKTIVKGDQ